MEDRFEILRFLQIHVEKQRLQQRGLIEIGLLQKRLLESGSMEPSMVKICSAQIGPVKARMGEIGGSDLSILEVSPFEIRSAKIDPRKWPFMEISISGGQAKFPGALRATDSRRLLLYEGPGDAFGLP